MAPGDVVFVVDPDGWQMAFRTHTGTLGTWMGTKNLQVLSRARFTAPQPGVPPRNRTGISYATGALASSHVGGTGFYAGGELETRVIALSKRAALVNLGTKPHEIRPVRTEHLVFFWPKAGRVVRRTSVQHPGTMAVPYLPEALESVIKPLR